MATSYDDAVATLHRAPHGEFVAERKRLASELKAAGDKTGAARLGKLPRPPISAWAVNQLWWQERAAFETFFSTAKKLREGDLGANAAHRDALHALRSRAQALLVDAGHAAAEATLRKVGTTLAALAATGSFDPDPAGALGDDRDPPGFEALGGFVGAPRAPVAEKDEAKADTKDDDAEERHRAAAAAREARQKEEAARRREAAVRAAERALASAKAERDTKRVELERLRKAVTTAERALAQAEARVAELEEEETRARDD